ncbi:MAG: peptidase domain-containing ABC transporter [Bacteroidales bacterium]|nr:peptidase domain-containing ABC transporter [Bacteroidales bacterium]
MIFGKKSFQTTRQRDSMDCGAACLFMIAKHYGRHYNIARIRENCYITREGVSLLGISDAAEKMGFKTVGISTAFSQLIEIKDPFIVHWKQNHFMVVYHISKNKVYIADPAQGNITLTHQEFIRGWGSTVSSGEPQGICLLVETTPKFYELDGEQEDKIGFSFLYKYFKPHRKIIFQLILGLVFGSLLQLVFPFLTQAVVDIGINTKNPDFIYLILFAQLFLLLGRVSIEYIRAWILLHVSTRINITLISDFLIKIMHLPIRFFDSKNTGDLLQRIRDHARIENFLTSQTLTILFSMLNLLIFGIVLAIYNIPIFLIFLVGSVLYVVWIYMFMQKRRQIDHKYFKENSTEYNNVIQLITGMQEIKLNNSEHLKRWEWERIQMRKFRINIQSLSLDQKQQVGGVFFNEAKNILITILSAIYVIQGDISLGMMLAIQYIVGQLNSPVEQMITFIKSAQDAKISLERLGEVHANKDEKEAGHDYVTSLPFSKDISIENATFQYEGPHSPEVIKNVSLVIPENKVTAIVGASGSGKTTLIKMLLGFYKPVRGKVNIGETNLNMIDPDWWRSKCGTVMQDGFIFSDSIASNIAVMDDSVDKEKLVYASKMANIQSFVEELPLGFNTKIGLEGIGVSQGQKQRILIARAVYKNPDILLLDEATNALDANNEKVILENLQQFFTNRTVVVVAHRLSTVKNADQIVVLDKGEIVEQGKHDDLVKKKGAYYGLVKNQLELGG